MRKAAWIMALVMAVFAITPACAQKTENKKNKKMETKTLVAYFSATGTTKAVAQQIAKATGGELCPIQPARTYSSADLDWTNANSRSSRENADAASRPAIVKQKKSLAEYTTIYIGFPIWWNVAPRVVNTFIESYDLTGKTVIPFATSGGSSIYNSVKVLQKTYPSINWQKGKLLNGPSDSEVKKWVDSL